MCASFSTCPRTTALGCNNHQPVANQPGLSPNRCARGLPSKTSGFPIRQRTSPRARAPVLRGVSLRLNPGERVALVGENGAGKSTLAKLLLGLYQSTAGEITVDGVHYDEIDRTSLASAVSAAFQDFFNFELTASQSIGIGALGSGGSDQEADLWPAWLPPDPAVVENAARRAGVDAITARLPQGYDTPVGHILDGGQGLSGGEWQRLAIARAFIRQPELLILDEPTAALDPMAEAEVYRQFGELLAGRTALLISHRLGSARMADRILVLKDGCIAEQGHLANRLLYIADLFTYLDLGPEESKEGESIDRVGEVPIAANGLSFRYPQAEQPAIDDISFTIQPGERVALVGTNGSGKTTLVKVLLGLFHPTQGKVLYGDVDLTQADRNGLWDQSAAVFQDYTRFAFSLGENIGLGRTERTSGR